MIAGEAQRETQQRATRIACLMVADFPLAALMRTNPELRERPFAVVRVAVEKQSANGSEGTARGIGCQPHSILSQVADAARAAGVRAGMTVAQGRALVPEMLAISPSAVAERAAADALIDVAESISPVVEEAAPGCVWVDLTGSERFYRHRSGARKNRPTGEPAANVGAMEDGGAAEDVDEASITAEEELAAEIVRRARRVGLVAAVGIAGDKEVARLAARCGGARVIGAGSEREFLDWMPLDLLELGVNARGDDLEMMLKRLGIRRLGELARLDARAVGSRLGSRGAELLRLARGEGSARVTARPRAEVFSEAIELEYGIETIEPLDFVMRAMIAHLTERLQLRGLAAGDITLALGLTDRRRDERRVAVAAPTLEVRALLTLVKLSLEAAPPAAPVETIRVTLTPRAGRAAQADMFLPPAPAPDRLETAIARIAALCGPDRVGRIAAADSYRPEAMRVGRFAPPPPAGRGQSAAEPRTAPPSTASREW